jgi:hypothetical protein
MKICSKCGIEKPKLEFHKRSNRKIGISSHCKVCEASRKPKEVVQKYNTEYYKANKPKIACYQKENVSAINAIAAKRRSAKIKRTPNWLTAEQYRQIKDIYQMAKQLETIFPWKQHVDHILPLQGKTVSGFHHPDNLQILSAKMNAVKHNSYEVA